MDTKRIARILSFAALCWLIAARSHAVTLLDLGLDEPPPLPAVTDAAGSPYYITNFLQDPAGGGTEAADASVAVETFRVGADTTVHVGYGPAKVADGGVTVATSGDMLVEGALHIGKAATQERPGMPNAATGKELGVTVGGDLIVAGGAMTATAGTAAQDGVAAPGAAIAVSGTTRIVDGGSLALRGADDATMATLSTKDLRIGRGGVLTMNSHSVAAVAGVAPGGTEAYYSAVVGDGGAIVLNGGVRPYLDPAAPPGDAWVFRGLDVSAGGEGLSVEGGGVLAGGTLGGTVLGAAGQHLIVRRGGALNASRGTVQVLDMDGVALHGAYLAGYGSSGITRLDAAGSRVDVYSTAALGMSRDLQRHINRLAYTSVDNAGILRGGEIVFENSLVPTLKSGMGTYTLALGAETATGVDMLYVTRVENGVAGDGGDPDRRRFRSNMESLWSPGGMGAAQANVIYDLAVSATPTVTASGAAGELNRQVLEAFVAGPGQAVGESGVADAGVYELYNGGAQFGPNAVAHGAASEMLSGLSRRVDFVADEMERRDGLVTTLGWASMSIPEDYNRRVWFGGFGRREEAELDYGIAGYEYKPNGFMAGYDKLYGDAVVVGGAVAYGAGDYEDRAALANDSEITSYSVGAYVGYRGRGGLIASAYGNYSYLQNDLKDVRGGMRRRADFDSHAWALGGKIGYELHPADRLTARPTIGLERIHAESGSHTERLDNLSVIRVGKTKRDSTLLPLDLGLGFDLLRGEASRLRLNANIGYAYDFDGDGMDGSLVYEGLAGAGAVPVADRELGRHRFNFGGGLQFSGTKLDFDARYDYYRRDSYRSHQFQGNLGVKF